MPVLLDQISIIIPKAIIREHYQGGEKAFRTAYSFSNDKANDEDDMLFALNFMGLRDEDIDALLDRGLVYDEKNRRSDHFVIFSRYHAAWECDWLGWNPVYAWHVEDEEPLIAEAKRIANTAIHELQAATPLGEPVLKTLRAESGGDLNGD